MFTVELDNLHLGCKANNKKEVLAMIAGEFEKKGYVEKDCFEALSVREQQISTFLGNGISLPHLPSSSKIVKNKGLEIFQFPDGVIWDKINVAFIVIAVASKDQEHINVLRDLAIIFSDEIVANALSIIRSKDEFINLLTHSQHD